MYKCCYICDPKCKYEDCICNENFCNFYNIYNEIECMPNDTVSIIKPWSISTMTICCKFNSSIILDKYSSMYCEELNAKKFYNCINTYLSIKYQLKSQISLKIFSNGNIQLAGVLNVKSVTYAIRKIFKRLIQLDAFVEKTSYISDLRICMINSDFKIDKNVKQSLLCKILETEKFSYIKRYSFNPSKYPGINIKFENPYLPNNLISCIIFRPGSIIITGGNDISAYKYVYEKVLNLLINSEDVLY